MSSVSADRYYSGRFTFVSDDETDGLTKFCTLAFMVLNSLHSTLCTCPLSVCSHEAWECSNIYKCRGLVLYFSSFQPKCNYVFVSEVDY